MKLLIRWESPSYLQENSKLEAPSNESNGNFKKKLIVAKANNCLKLNVKIYVDQYEIC